jgi:hypothetical protein
MSALSILELAVAKVKAEQKELEDQLAATRATQVQAFRALNALYNLSGDLKKPSEHKPTRDAMRLAEMALHGYYSTPTD